MIRSETFDIATGFIPSRGVRVASAVLFVISLALFALSLIATYQRQTTPSTLLLLGIGLVLSTVIVLHMRFLLGLRSQHRKIFTCLEATAQDKEHAERQLRANRALARSASVEADALRATALTLTENCQLDRVLDTLLESLLELVPYQSARVLLLEDSSRLFVAGENTLHNEAPSQSAIPLTFDLAGFPLLKRAVRERGPMLLRDVEKEAEWRQLFASETPTRSWLCVPLVAADRTLGVLCAEHNQASAFTSEHLRLARSVAVPVAAAIQNARLYEQAQIYGAELEKRIADLRRTQRALEEAEEQRLISEGKFHSVFRSSPIAFCIITLNEERFVDVNQAFEQRYGYSGSELIGRTVNEIGFWEDAAERRLIVSHLDKDVPVRNLITRLRTKSGELKLTAYSADRIQFDGKACILAVSGDILQNQPDLMN
jgi:PAS domain S-box-containing protein